MASSGGFNRLFFPRILAFGLIVFAANSANGLEMRACKPGSFKRPGIPLPSLICALSPLSPLLPPFSSRTVLYLPQTSLPYGHLSRSLRVRAGADGDIDAFVQDVRRTRSVRRLGIVLGYMFLSAAMVLQSCLSSNPNVGLGLGPFLLVGASLLYTKRAIVPRNRELEVGTDFEVREAAGKGLGLFALRSISKGTYLCDYGGER
ncbi:hypothetical protein AAMO2058_001186200 [Amorphochlora amoebiformis]